MRLTENEAQLLRNVLSVVERAEIIEAEGEDRPFLSAPLPETSRLLGNPNPDLADIGLYVLSFGPVTDEMARFVENERAAYNMSRFLSAEIGIERVGAWIEDRPLLRERVGPQLPFVITAMRTRPGEPPKTAPANDMTIIIHGTWARSESWWQPGGGFWNYIKGKAHNLYGGSDIFSWSGQNSHSARLSAGKELLQWAQAHPAANLDIIAHSHGGNVALLASRYGLKIRKLINLGTPIRTEYLPNLRNIEILYNVFSTRDHVQTPTGTVPNRRGEGRTLADSLQMINFRATDDGKGNSPGHSELHEPDTWMASAIDALLV